MNPEQEKLRALLDEVLPTSAEHCGPSRLDVLHLLRHERQRRRRLHTGTAALVVAAAALGTLFWHGKPPAPVALTSAKPAPLVIRNVNDEQFLTLLQGTPTALMEWPNGNRTLFIIEH